LARFGFIIHPLSARQITKLYPALKLLPDRMIEAILAKQGPRLASEVTGIKSKTGVETTGVLVGCSATPKMFARMPVEKSYEMILDAVNMAVDNGAEIVGLGAFTSVVGDAGVTIAERSPVPITTGNSYTVATAIQGTLEACDILELDKSKATIAVVGSTGSIGRTCAQVLSPEFAKAILIGRDIERTTESAAGIPNAVPSIDVKQIIEADVVVSVTSSETSVIQPEDIKLGAIICDVARPRDVSRRVAEKRPDVLVIEGGVVKVPGTPDFGIDFGFPKGTAYACMSETFMLALEDRAESFTLGKTVSKEQVEEMLSLAEKHGFELEGFRAFEKAVTEETIERVKAARLVPSSA
jgi:predicted amino acid dehydrogenase